MTARNHHFIPQTYLRGFSEKLGGKQQLAAYSFDSRKEFITSPRNVATERDFNRIDSDSEDPNYLEYSMGEFEASISPTINRIGRDKVLSEETLSVILTMMALYSVCNPAVRDQVHSHHEKVMKLMLKHAACDEGRFQSMLEQYEADGFDASGISRDDLASELRGDNLKLEKNREFLIDIEMQQIVPITKCLAERQWNLLSKDSSTGNFITCDRPVSIEWIKPDEVPPFLRNSPGLALRNTIVFFPLNRNMCVAGSFEGYFRDCIVTPDIVAHTNSAQIASANRQIYYYPNEGFKFRAKNNLVNNSDLEKHFNK